MHVLAMILLAMLLIGNLAGKKWKNAFIILLAGIIADSGYSFLWNNNSASDWADALFGGFNACEGALALIIAQAISITILLILGFFSRKSRNVSPSNEKEVTSLAISNANFTVSIIISICFIIGWWKPFMITLQDGCKYL
tara:strand:+ start:2565 stop:2984 length:420 start_codon:yes stop_codon:yes gene_type:complete